MTPLNLVYKCNLCVNIVEILHPVAGALVCCNEKMALMVQNTVDAPSRALFTAAVILFGLMALVAASIFRREDKKPMIWVLLALSGYWGDRRWRVRPELRPMDS